MYLRLLFFWLILLVSCRESDQELDFSSSITNTCMYSRYDGCSRELIGSWLYILDEERKVYLCEIGRNSEFQITKGEAVLNRLSVIGNVIDYAITYDSKKIIGLSEIEEFTYQLFEIDIDSKETKTMKLPKSPLYEFSNHPISEDNKIVFKSIDTMYLFSFQENKLHSLIGDKPTSPNISKDGKSILFVKNNGVYEFDISKTQSTLIKQFKNQSFYSLISAFYDSNGSIITKGVKYTEIKPLENVLYKKIDIKSRKVVREGTGNIGKKFKYISP